jgi:hypothetical protein
VADPGKLKNFKLWLETSKEPLNPTLVSLCGDSAIFLQTNLGDAKPTQVIVADALNQKAPAVASYEPATSPETTGKETVLAVREDYSPLFSDVPTADLKGECFNQDGLGKHAFAAWLEVGGATYQATVRALCKTSAVFSAKGLGPQAPTTITLQDNSNGEQLILHPKGRKFTEDLPLPLEGDFSALTNGAQDLDGKCFTPAALKTHKFVAWLQVGPTSFEADVMSLCESTALFLPHGMGKQRPTTITIQDGSNSRLLTVPYVAPVALKAFSVPFFSPDFVKVCNERGNPGSCPATDLGSLKVDVLPPEGVKDKPKVSVLHADMAVVEFTAPIDFRAKAIVVTSPVTKEAVMVRDLPGPQPITTQPNVSFSVIDPNTVGHNFGDRIARRYIAVDLQIKNPGVKKIQVQKSSIWFEADYIAAARQGSWVAYSPRVKPPFFNRPAIYGGEPVAYPWPCGEAMNAPASEWTTEAKARHSADCSKFAKLAATGRPKVFRYGLEHRHQLFPETYAVVQGTFDDISGSLKTATDYTTTATAAASGLSSLIKGHSYLPVLSVFSAIVLPGFKDFVFNEETERRLRSQLLAQAFPEIVQIPPVSSATWKIFLPKRVISNDFPEMVLVEQLRDVHMELETVSEPVTEAVVKGQVQLGMTQEQVIQALGVPSRTQTDDKTGKVTWSYEQGSYQSVEFTPDQNKQLKVTGFVQRLAAPEVTATPGEQKVTLNWNPIDGATSYNIYKGTEAGGEEKTPIKPGGTDTSFMDTDATGDKPYFYQVTAVNSEGEGARSNEVSATPKPAAAGPPTPAVPPAAEKPKPAPTKPAAQGSASKATNAAATSKDKKVKEEGP